LDRVRRAEVAGLDQVERPGVSFRRLAGASEAGPADQQDGDQAREAAACRTDAMG